MHYSSWSERCVRDLRPSCCLLRCVGSAKLQDVLMQCVFGSRKSKASSPRFQRSPFQHVSTGCPRGSVLPGTDHLRHRAAVSTTHCVTSGFNSCFTKSTRWPRCIYRIETGVVRYVPTSGRSLLTYRLFGQFRFGGPASLVLLCFNKHWQLTRLTQANHGGTSSILKHCPLFSAYPGADHSSSTHGEGHHSRSYLRHLVT